LNDDTVIESVARAMCVADGRNPDERATVAVSQVLTAGEMHAGERIAVAEPLWRHYRRAAILHITASNAQKAEEARAAARAPFERHAAILHITAANAHKADVTRAASRAAFERHDAVRRLRQEDAPPASSGTMVTWGEPPP
jgi:hypothetical protein